jgi:hypothetical protein
MQIKVHFAPTPPFSAWTGGWESRQLKDVPVTEKQNAQDPPRFFFS